MNKPYDITPKAHIKQPKKARPSLITNIILVFYAAVVTFIMLAGIAGWVCIALGALKYLLS